MAEISGVIYILTNPSFPEYVKIGYATDVQQRLNELNSSTAVPFAFRIYATYEVESKLSDKKLHSILDKLDPDLRSSETIDGRKRVREFYAMSAEDAYEILEAIAEINNHTDRLKLWPASEEDKKDESIAEQNRERLSPFTFDKCNIGTGEEIEFWENSFQASGIIATVVDIKHVKYEGQTWSLTALTKKLLNTDGAVAGPKYFKYKGEWLNDIRRRLGNWK